MTTMRNVPLRAGLTLAAVALAAAACSSAAGGSGPAPGSGTAPARGASNAATTITTKNGPDGTYLTDRAGDSLYLWEKDTPGHSACSGACAAAWPPVKAAGQVTASGGARSSLLGTVTRPDGTRQVTYKGWPLYTFAGDSGAGQVNGQGSDNFGAKWWLVSAGGTPVTGAGAPAPSSSSGTGSGYGGGGY